jgi:hypothetical protein
MKTIPISEQAHRKIKAWCCVKKMTFEAFVDRWVESAELKIQSNFYNGLKVSNYVKPLDNVRLENGFIK